MDRVRAARRRPAVWLFPLVVAAIQLVGSTRTRHRGGPDLEWVPLNWFGYVLLIAGPVALLLRTIYPYTVLLIVIAITGAYLAAGFRFGPIFVSLIGTIICFARRWRGRGGERTLRDAYAKGEVNEAEYRERLAVLRETRR